ncbi:UNVERIFIED_CONTAM: hypothetical protein Cloal_2848 [Acetivibrio alkalicellulosi]
MMNDKKSQRQGLNCPECDFFIEISIPQLLGCDDFMCAGCGLAITLDRQSSRESMEALSQLNVALDNINILKKKYSAK